MGTLRYINYIITIVFSVCYAYQFLFIPLVWLLHKKKVYTKSEPHNFAVLICARNEAEVIGDLIGSIRSQTYDQSLIHIFVLADNCTDNTKEVSEAAGAVVYTRQNAELIGKGYALTELMGHLREDYPEGFDGYFVFDADNILSPNYFEEMNRTFTAGHDVITSYRNSKNFGTNWISAGYALWFLRESRYLNHARFLLGSSCAVSGTGFMFSRKVADEIGNWPYHMLTEDIQFSVEEILKGRKIAFCPTAELFDEQPVKFSQSWRQRLRWSKGYIQVFRGYGAKLIRGMFRGSFSCFDMTMTIMPAFVLSIISALCNIALGVRGTAMGDDMMVVLGAVGQLASSLYFTLFSFGAFTTLTEWKHIHTSAWKKLFFMFTFPLFMFTYVPISVAALVCKIDWKPIKHSFSVEKLKCEEADMRTANAERRRRRRMAAATSICVVIAAAAVIGINVYVMAKGDDGIILSAEAAELDGVDCIVVLGCETKLDGTVDDMLEDRLDCGVGLYENGAAPKLLMSGEKHERDHDAAEVMRNYALASGVPSGDILTDLECESTYDSILRAKELFGADRIVIVAQEYQLPRALYIAGELGIDAYGVSSDYHIYEWQSVRECGEIFLRVKDFGLSIMKPEQTEETETELAPDEKAEISLPASKGVFAYCSSV